MKHCYRKVEDGVETIAVIDEGPPRAQITIHTRRNGKDVEAPVKTAGRIEGQEFVYADGTRLTFTAEELRGPARSA